MGQGPRQLRPELLPVQKPPERRLPRLRAELLFGRADGDGLLACLELDCFGHPLVSPSQMAFMLNVLHRISISQTVAPFPTASLRLRSRFD